MAGKLNVGHSDERCRYYVKPTRVVWSDQGAGRIEKLDAVLSDDLSECVVTPDAKSPPSIILDFGQELSGGIGIDVTNRDPAHLLRARLRFGESVSEVMGTPVNDHAMHDTVVDISVWSRYEYGCTGFRFLRVDFLECAQPIHIRSMYAVALERPYEYKGSFNCSDPVLNDIWKVGARTVHLCCQDYILDGIKRDRLVWMGDIHPQLHVIAAVFGDVSIVDESIARVLELTNEGEWVNGISSYSIWWLIGVWEWYFYTGRLDWLKGMHKNTIRLTDQLLAHIDNDGHEKLGGLRFVDWSVGNDKPDVVDASMPPLAIMALNACAKIFGLLGDASKRDECLAVANKIRHIAMPQTSSKHVHALRVLAQMEEAAFANRHSLAVDPCRGLSPWFGYYMLEARTLAGDISGCVDLLKKYWGSMISLGATTYWEHFEVDWCDNAARIDEIVPSTKRDVHVDGGAYCFVGLRHSLCHGWSGGPTAWLSRHLLGIRPSEAGFKAITFRPNMANLDFVEGTFPTPYGTIEAYCRKSKSGAIERSCKAPQEIKVLQ